MNKTITTAIIPVAGYGSRMLPITKAIEKCMLPVLNRPIIDYVVQDCIKAGVSKIIFVVGEGSEQLQKYYGHHSALEQYLHDQNKDQYIPLISPPKDVTFLYIEQPQGSKYGTAIPVALAKKAIHDEEHVLVLMGDDFIWNEDDSSEVARLITTVATSKEAALIGVSVPPEDVSKYGVIEKDTDGYFVSIVEKPLQSEAPSNLINVSKYVLPADLLDEIAHYANEDLQGGEYMITEPINKWVQAGGKLRVHESVGKYFDGGNPEGWLYANTYIAEHNR
jgi:UTP--glucose-1-phosphate uridylyltransferase